MKIGIIQNAPLTADFTNNLRQIVQGYRECLDHGAQIVVASAIALCGPKPEDLATRSSFLSQTQAALKALSHELGKAPLLLGACVPLLPSEVREWDIVGAPPEVKEVICGADRSPCVDYVPFLVEKDSVTELPDSSVARVGPLTVYVDIYSGEILPEQVDYDLLVHLCDLPWSPHSPYREESTRLLEAASNGVPVVQVQSIGTAGSTIYAGGSCICNPERNVILRLPFFEEGNRVIDLYTTKKVRSLLPIEQMLMTGLAYGIRNHARQNGYSSVCLPLDHTNSPLLAGLCVEALGSSQVHGVSFGNNRVAEATAAALGITLHQPDAAPLLAAAKAAPDSALGKQLQAALLVNIAEEGGHMLLSPLSRYEIMLGFFTPYAETCGDLAPLGDIYRMDASVVEQELVKRYPGLPAPLFLFDHARRDRIIHELANINRPPAELLLMRSDSFPEDEVRFVQRRIAASALNRVHVPTILNAIDSLLQRTYPLYHRLND